MKANIQTKVEGAGVITQTKMVKIEGRTFRMTSTIRQVASPAAKPASKSTSSFAQLAQNISKAKTKNH
jgi:hypothetical protein